jgi:hypothetical protein
MGISIMYSPYAEQSVAALVYVLLSFFLVIVNSKRLRKTTFGVWICKILRYFSYGIFECVYSDVSVALSGTVEL